MIAIGRIFTKCLIVIFIFEVGIIINANGTELHAKLEFGAAQLIRKPTIAFLRRQT